MLELGVDGDHPLRPEHLQLEVDVVGDRHEFGLCRPSEDRVIRSWEADHLEGECLLVEVSLSIEGESFTYMPLRKMSVTHTPQKSSQIPMCHAPKVHLPVCHFGWIRS
jgi:hypothetical protein